MLIRDVYLLVITQYRDDADTYGAPGGNANGKGFFFWRLNGKGLITSWHDQLAEKLPKET